MNLKARKSKATKEMLSSMERRKELWGYRKGTENLESAEKQKSMTASLIPTPASQQEKKTIVIMSFQLYRGIWYKCLCPI